jgi:hypothetical protein
VKKVMMTATVVLFTVVVMAVLPLGSASAKDPNNTTDPKCSRAWTVKVGSDSYWSCKRTGYMFRDDGSDVFVFHQASTSPPLSLRLVKPTKVTSSSMTWGKKRYALNCAGNRPVCVLERA